jgi:tRNA threonylcarbamoyladenosine biosynthesis protein TsaB
LGFFCSLFIVSFVIFALDTATRSIGLALLDDDNLIAEMMWHSENNHTVELAPNVESLFKAHHVAARDLKAVAVAIGPGSFNGVRIGLGFAKGLSLARDVPLIGVRTLDILVNGVSPFNGGLIPVIQAGRGRIIWARYKVGQRGWESASAGVVSDWATLKAHAEENDRIIGEIDQVGSSLIDPQQIESCSRRPFYLAQIARERLLRGDVDDAATLSPIYAHQPTSGES